MAAVDKGLEVVLEQLVVTAQLLVEQQLVLQLVGQQLVRRLVEQQLVRLRLPFFVFLYGRF